jgi:sugar O-acyltransferase (sialic acid O-acetyltransferase NeuD family)
MKLVFFGAANPETLRMIAAIRRVDPAFSALGFLDNDPDKKGARFHGLPVYGGFECIPELIADDDVRFVNLITGNMVARCQVTREIIARGGRLANFVHPSLDLNMVRMGVGNYIQEAVVLQAEVEIGDNSSLHMGALVGHESRIGHSVFVAHAVSVSGSVDIGDGCFIGTNATIIPRIRIGKWATVGAGSVVTKDVPAHAVVVGNPARVIKSNPVHLESGRVFDE